MSATTATATTAPSTSTSTSNGGGPTDLLLRFFDSEWFDAWIAVTCVLLFFCI